MSFEFHVSGTEELVALKYAEYVCFFYRILWLRFVLLEENPAAVEQMMQSLANISREVGLEINASKTKLMSNSREIDVMDRWQQDRICQRIYLPRTNNFPFR
ncbi:unnamed protein product [Pieris macdunnoughi]|uniref:Uncharacterized protein n=1 Tax=Pieris macdunnoughi TaxID=345717 RepID=A0A821Y5C5_9NEOP|nr:unnamed protein product [Pieris macdunnoughi]